MKKINFIVVLLLISFVSFGQIKNASLTATGLTCSMCSKSIYKALTALSTVEKVDVDIDKSIFNVTFKGDAIVKLDDVKKAVENAGFFVSGFDVTLTLPATQVNNDTHIMVGGSTFHFLAPNQKTIAGVVTLKLLDKGFAPNKEHKKYAKFTKMACYETGKHESCCTNTPTNSRIYHVTL